MLRKALKTLLPILAIALILCVLGALYLRATAPTAEETARDAQKQEELRLQSVANMVIGDIQYIKDTRTNICYALYCNVGALTLATVPCDSIPPELLFVLKENK